ncbi:cytochrome C oxidase subunit IV family protein [Labilibaculum sp. K2S]|uniref:cytochrome C oxidase subunit IV family protein n=1 Tax=Labilibaculum sp. K2S TaxID=3056386 RepID=UPI0025A4125C|nr:cytochrome C oxidase subunit IV family protein [Labilibaculum sp. K2S]MDM8158991.1 cytochrome C oxidase subunit IV family protein [Labilibaculum sp. K2S]
MEKEQHTHIVKYKTYVFVLIALLLMTFTSVAITSLNLGPYTVSAALLLAGSKSLLVLLIFMHLKFDKKFYSIMVGGVFLLFASVIFITFLDYLYR